MPSPDPSPPALRRALEELDAGRSYRAALEELLCASPPAEADGLMQILREGRGAWTILLHGAGGRALFLGNALSGSLIALARAGYRVTALDTSPERLAWATRRHAHHGHGELETRLHQPGPRLPFGDDSFDLLVQEDGRLGRDGEHRHGLGELRRLTREELVLTGDNRLAYKLASGKRADFRVPSPTEFARRVLNPRAGELTLGGYRRALGEAGFCAPRAFALYPHRHDFSHVVALDTPFPALTIGSKERANRLKLLGQRLGLFPHLTPSFAFLTGRGDRTGRPTRLERILEQLAAHIGEPQPVPEHLVATRGNSAIVQTALPGAEPTASAGRWTVRLPLSAYQETQARTHLARLGVLRRDFPRVPVPEPLFIGRLEGLTLGCERRLGGAHTAQLAGPRANAARTYDDVARHFSQLLLRRAPCDEPLFESLVGAKLDLVARHARVPSTLRWLEELRAEARDLLLGRELPLVLGHLDLRGKHVQAASDGRVLGYLDWGSSEEESLPHFDLFHLLVHDRKQERGCSAGRAWRGLRDDEDPRPHERAAVEQYAERVGLDGDLRTLVERLYPALVAAMAEANWDYSRPRWLHASFEL